MLENTLLFLRYPSFLFIHKWCLSSFFTSIYDKPNLSQMVLHDSDHKNLYATGGQTRIPIFVTGVIEVDSAEIAVLDSDLGSIETKKKYVFNISQFQNWVLTN